MDEDQYLDSYWEDRNEMNDGWDDHPTIDDFDEQEEEEQEEEDFIPDEPDDMTDVEADADTLRSCGWGTDEDYGYFGPDSDE